MILYAMRDKNRGKFVAEGWSESIVNNNYLKQAVTLAEVYNKEMCFLFKPTSQAKYMEETYSMNIEIVKFERKLVYEVVE